MKTLRIVQGKAIMRTRYLLRLLAVTLLLASCSGSDNGGSAPQNVALDEGGVTTMLEGLTYELVPDGGASAGSSVQSWRWSASPIIEGALSQCASVEQFNLEQAATGLEAACTVPGKCTLSFDQVATAGLLGTGQSRFSVRVPVLKADVGVTYRLEAVDTNGQTTVGNFTFCLIATNERPTAGDDAFTVIEGTPLVVSGAEGINLLTNDTDDIYVGNEPLTVNSAPIRAPAQATSFALQPDGGFTYLYEGDAVVAGGTQIRDSFVYEVSDGTFSTIATVNLTIVAVDNPPQLSGDLPDQNIVAGVPVEVDFAEFFTDPEDGDLFFTAIGLPPSGELALTPLGVLTGMATPDDVGNYQVQIQADDQQNNAVGLFNLVISGNLPPITEPIPDQMVAFGELVSIEVIDYFTDPEGIELTFSLQSEPPSDLAINPETGLITGLITEPGDYQLTVTADDAANNLVSLTFVLSQQAQPNQAPVFEGLITSQSVTIGDPINPVSGEFSDPDDDVLTYSINNSADGLSFDDDSGVLSGTPTELGISSFVITAEDPEGLTVSSNLFQITVTAIPNEAPTFTGTIADQTGRVEVPITPISGNFSDPDGDTLTFTSTTLPTGLSLSATGVISGTPTETGQFTITITAADPQNASVSSNEFSLTIEPPVNNPPVITSTQPGSLTIVEGGSAGFQVQVSDEDLSSLNYSALTGDSSIATVTGGTNGSFSVAAIAPGSTQITITVTDDAAQSASGSVSVTVTAIPNEPPVITERVPAGNLSLDQGQVQLVNLVVTDEEPATLIYSGTTSDATVAAVTINANNSFNVTGIAAGQATIVLQVEDDDGQTDSESFSVTVAPPPNQPPQILERDPPGNLELQAGQSQIVRLTVDDESPATLTFDKSSSDTDVATISLNVDNSFTVNAVSEGQATLILTVTDAEGLSDSESLTVSVTAVPDNPPVINSRSPTGAVALEPGQSTAVTLSVSDEDVASLLYSGVSGDTDIATVAVNADNTFTITAVDDGQTTIALTVTDTAGQSDTDNVTVNVESANLPPVIESREPSGNAELAPGDSLSVTLTVNDESVATLDYAADSDNPSVATVQTGVNGAFTISAIADGEAEVTFSVTDDAGSTVTDSMKILVETANLAPVIETVNPGTQLDLEVGQSQSVQLSVTDEAVASLDYDALSDDEAIASVLVGDNGEFTVTAESAGSTSILFTVTDVAGLSDSVTVQVSVTEANAAPVITNRSPSGVIELQPLESLTVTLTVSDEDPTTLIFAAASDTESVATVTPAAGGDYTIEAGVAGTATLTLTVTDSGGLSATETVFVEVTDAAPPPPLAQEPGALLQTLGSERVSLPVSDI